jgi:hypothetical protein
LDVACDRRTSDKNKTVGGYMRHRSAPEAQPEPGPLE